VVTDVSEEIVASLWPEDAGDIFLNPEDQYPGTAQVFTYIDFIISLV
jgi:hypothetical protein